jgi:rRNA processing protein Gar1
LQRLGLILHVTPSRNIIARIENVPRIGATVVDENLKTVGKVWDLLGPVCSPYATIAPTIRDPERLANRMAYILPSKRRKEKRRYE